MRVGEKDVSEQAEIVARYAHLFSPEQLEALREARGGCDRRRARAPLPAAQDVRRRPDLGAARRAGGRARERDPRHERRLPRRGVAAAHRAGAARRARRATPTARSSASSSAAASRASFNPDRLELIAAGEELAAELSGDPDPVARNEEEKAISLRELSSGARRRRRRRPRTRTSGCARAGSSGCSAPSATRCRRASTRPTCAGSRRSSRPTRRSARPRSASRR